MPRKLATIRKIKDIQPIPEADKIEKIQIDGWWCVSKKGEFSIGDMCVYFEIDSFLPLINQFKFLSNKGTKKMTKDGKELEGYRLKTVRLKGQLSQGLALPLSLFPEINETMYDVTDILNVILYEPPIPSCLNGIVKGGFPSFIPKTDEERVQNSQLLLDTHKGKSFTITEKLDGTSSTFYKYNGVFGVCGRNYEYEESNNTYWQIANKYDLKNVLPEGYAIQGEIIGEGIQKNPLKLSGHSLRVFYVYDIENKRHISPAEMVEFCQNYNLNTVPIIEKDFKMINDIYILLEMANRKSLISKSCDAEGIVFVCNDSQHKTSFKAISNKLL